MDVPGGIRAGLGLLAWAEAGAGGGGVEGGGTAYQFTATRRGMQPGYRVQPPLHAVLLLASKRIWM